MTTEEKKTDKEIGIMAEILSELINNTVNEGHKAGVWICSIKKGKVRSRQKTTACAICKVKIVYAPSMEKNMEKEHIKICNLCALKKYPNMPEIQKKIIKAGLI